MTTPIQPDTGRPKRPGFIRRHRTTAISSAAALVVGIGIGALLLTPAYTATLAKNDIWRASYADLEGQQAQTKNDLSAAKNREATVSEREQALTGRETAVSDREKAVSATEQKIKENSFTGGMLVVGKDVTAGTYRTGELSSSCYYAWKSGTGSDADIVDNNIVREGTATVTLKDGQTFESRSCGTWTKIG